MPMSPDEEEDYPRRESPSLLENTSPNAQSFGDLLPKREKLVTKPCNPCHLNDFDTVLQ